MIEMEMISVAFGPINRTIQILKVAPDIESP